MEHGITPRSYEALPKVAQALITLAQQEIDEALYERQWRLAEWPPTLAVTELPEY